MTITSIKVRHNIHILNENGTIPIYMMTRLPKTLARCEYIVDVDVDAKDSFSPVLGSIFNLKGIFGVDEEKSCTERMNVSVSGNCFGTCTIYVVTVPVT